MSNRPSFDPDRALESAASKSIRELVRALPDDEPSMVWRSELNERIVRAARERRRKRWLTWTFAPTAGVAMAAAFAFVVLAPKSPAPTTVAQTGGVERLIVETHLAGATAGELSSFGLYASIGHPAGGAAPASELHEWSEVDLDAL